MSVFVEDTSNKAGHIHDLAEHLLLPFGDAEVRRSKVERTSRDEISDLRQEPMVT